jgi:hypothetical protein
VSCTEIFISEDLKFSNWWRWYSKWFQAYVLTDNYGYTPVSFITEWVSLNRCIFLCGMHNKLHCKKKKKTVKIWRPDRTRWALHALYYILISTWNIEKLCIVAKNGSNINKWQALQTFLNLCFVLPFKILKEKVHRILVIMADFTCIW